MTAVLWEHKTTFKWNLHWFCSTSILNAILSNDISIANNTYNKEGEDEGDSYKHGESNQAWNSSVSFAAWCDCADIVWKLQLQIALSAEWGEGSSFFFPSLLFKGCNLIQRLPADRAKCQVWKFATHIVTSHLLASLPSLTIQLDLV